MFDRILPARVDNRYRGHRLALWLFVPIAAQKVALGLTHILTGDGGAQSIATIPLDRYPADATQNIIGMFARLGLAQLAIAAIFVLVLVRYRSLIPFMYALSLVQFLAGQAIGRTKPLVLAGTSGVGTPFLVIAILTAIGLVLSLMGRGYAEPAQSRASA